MKCKLFPLFERCFRKKWGYEKFQHFLPSLSKGLKHFIAVFIDFGLAYFPLNSANISWLSEVTLFLLIFFLDELFFVEKRKTRAKTDPSPVSGFYLFSEGIPAISWFSCRHWFCDFLKKTQTFGSILATLTFTFNWSLGGSLCFIEGKHSQEINDFSSYWPFCYPIMIPRDQKALAKEAIDPVKYKAYNGILLPKLFWPTVRKNVIVIEKNFWNSRLKAKYLKIFWDH